MKVLIGVDGSADSLAAVSLTGQLLSPQQDEIAFYYSPPQVQIKNAPKDSEEILQKVQHDLTEAVFDRSREQLPEAFHEKIHTIVGTNPPKQGLLIASEQWRSEMIVVGARGLGLISKMVLGSVASNVARSATIPVLVVRPDSVNENPIKALLAFDGSPASRKTAEVINRLTWPKDAIGEGVSVIEPMSIGPIPDWLQQKVRSEDTEQMARAWADEHQEEIEEKSKQLADFLRRLPQAFQKSEPIIAEGPVSFQILETINRRQSNLVIIGGHAKSVWKRLLSGSVTEAILSHAPCSVLLIHEPEQP